MKYGIIVHKTTTNLGDDIQSLACEQLLPNVDYYIDRESIDKFNPIEPVGVIMAGWWMWKKYNWPPSSKIIPYFTGFHYQSFKDWKWWDCAADTVFIKDGIGNKYLEAYSPIGCRDFQTLDLLQNYGIPSYFSGCVTLTLDGTKFKDENVEPYIVLVDVGKECESKVQELLAGTEIKIKIVTHNIKNTEFNWRERKRLVEETLKTYCNARCVLTYRLHAALPCLAMNTPVLLIRESMDETRFNPYSDWIFNTTVVDFLNDNCDFSIINPQKNKNAYLPYREKTLSGVKDFIRKCKDGKIKMFEDYFSKDEINEWKVAVLNDTCEQYRRELEAVNHEKKVLEKKIKSFK